MHDARRARVVSRIATGITLVLIPAMVSPLVAAPQPDAVSAPEPEPAASRQPSPSVTASAPGVTPDSEPDAGRGAASGEAMPGADLPGWSLVFADDFAEDVEIGTFPESVAGAWSAYPYPWRTLSGVYHPHEVVSVHDGVMDLWLRQHDGEWLMAAPQPRINGADRSSEQLYGRYAIRFRADPLPGYYLAWLLWPASEVWPRDGEIDFPEGELTGPIGGFVHPQGGTRADDQEAHLTDVPFTGWHTAVIEWAPDRVTLILDGIVVGESTRRIPNTPMRWVIQTTTSPAGPPPDGTSGHVEIDWVAVWRHAP